MHTLKLGLVLQCAWQRALFFSGCATTAPQAAFTQEIASSARIADQDAVKATVTASPGIEILEVEKTRIAQRVEERIAAKQLKNPAATEPRSYAVELELTRYEKAMPSREPCWRAWQIHIDGVVKVFCSAGPQTGRLVYDQEDLCLGRNLCGATSMEDIERTFADGWRQP